MLFKSILGILICLTLFACYSSDHKVPQFKNIEIVIDGLDQDSIWTEAKTIDNFSCPWTNDSIQLTKFKILTDSQYLYFHYTAFDKQIICYNHPKNHKAVIDSDRIELFFNINEKMNPYYGLEMDACGRVMPFKGVHYRKVNYQWAWPGLKKEDISSDKFPDGYTVEGKLSLDTLRALQVLKNRTLNIGLFRGDYAAGHNGQEVLWHTWKDPMTEKPDFHVASAIGKMILSTQD